ncbi:MAG TPA: TonB-dependent receptor, partial [Thermoanaerobaculia bacterium]|nr:TonB-dependent receptor [Thermoanaerobaculia bacterium]
GVSAEVSAGSQETGTAAVFAATDHASVAIDLLRTGGYVLVRPSERGAIDIPADSEHASVDATLRGAGAFLRASYYDESRENGTPLQVNDTTIRQLAGGGDFVFGGGQLTLRAFGSDQDFRQTFSAVAANRAIERLTLDQRIPSRGFGGSAQWSRPIGTRHAILTGAELRDVRATVDAREVQQRITAAFVEDIFVATPSLSLTTGIRVDSSEWSPRLSALYRISDDVALTASAYRAFREPTLNELYRPFRVGNILTIANDNLGNERLTAFEMGARVRNVRVNLFTMETVDAVANVTLSVTPTLITRQRQNVGESRSRGAEIEADWHLRATHLSFGYLFADAVIDSGKRVPQVARHQLTAQASWNERVGVQARWSTRQFDDDLNQFPLRGYFVADAFASHPLHARLDATLAIENLFDRRIEASATPVITLGQPRAWRAGLRWRM